MSASTSAPSASMITASLAPDINSHPMNGIVAVPAGVGARLERLDRARAVGGAGHERGGAPAYERHLGLPAAPRQRFGLAAPACRLPACSPIARNPHACQS